MSITIIVEPTEEPITLAEAVAQVSAYGTAHDAELTSMIVAARRHVEAKLQRGLITQTRALRLDGFPRVLKLRDGLLQSVTSIAYVDTAGATQTLDVAAYQVDRYSDPPRVKPAFGSAWPPTRDQLNAVTVTYVCGYGVAAAVPQDIKSAMKLIVGDLFNNRESSIVGASYVETPTVAALLADYVSYAD